MIFYVVTFLCYSIAGVIQRIFGRRNDENVEQNERKKAAGKNTQTNNNNNSNKCNAFQLLVKKMT